MKEMKTLTFPDGSVYEIVDDKCRTNKVDKEDGKGLSTNDYDNTAKQKVDAIPEDPKYTDTVYDDTVLANKVSDIGDDVTELQTDTANLKTDVKNLGTDVETAQTNIEKLQEDATGLRDDVEFLFGKDALNELKYSDIQYVVAQGRAGRYFNVGDQIVANWNDGTAYEDLFNIVQLECNPELEGGENPHGMMIQQHYANVRNCPFDPQEALYDADEELPAGTYHFTVAGDTWLSSENGKVIQFTLTQPIPAGGQLVYSSTEGYNKEIAGQNISTYASPTSFTAIETVALSEGSEGTDLGKTDGKGDLNHHQRAFRGCNRWKTSMLRQYLNSDKPAGEWWTKQDKWDRASSFINSYAGYMAGFDADFLAIIKPVKVQTARDTVVYDGGTDVTYDTFFPISLEQLNAAPQISGVEGSALDYWKAVAAADTTGNLDSYGRFKQSGAYPDLITYGLNAKTTARNCWLRSAYRGNSYIAWLVSTSGYVGSSNALNGFYCAPACVICNQ